ncbi:MAG TPA: IS110 family transposase [Flavipsychrobacter sp.]|nr:IS110 family transposase [Flavipsychrobacter sp.]
MIKKLLKQVVGIDVAHKKIDVSLGCMDQEANTEIYAYKTFNNNEKGFAALLLWVKKYTQADTHLRFVMEATGIYHEALAYHLSAKGYTVSIVMPTKVTNFFRTLDVKTVTDKTMSETIALYGLERKLEDWVRPQKVYRELRQVTRERDQLIAERTMNKNQLHAEQTEANPYEKAVARIKARIVMLNKQIKEIISEITDINKNNDDIAEATKLITTIPGVGLLTAITVLAETDGFSLIHNKRQLTSYAGLDVKEKESGTSIRCKPRISKRGNKHLRKAMHLPALAAIRHCERYRSTYATIVSRTGIKMKAAVAVQRKLLEMIYTIYTTKKPFDVEYLQKETRSKQDLKKIENSSEELFPIQADI